MRTSDKPAALFANLDFKIAPTLKVTVGGRVGIREVAHDLHFDGSFNGGPGFFEGDEKDKPVHAEGGPDLAADRRPAPTTSPSRKGYRVGGVNPQTNNAQPGCQTALAADDLTGKLLQTYNPDSLWSYEIGAKSRLLDNRLEIQTSAYHIKWSDIQQAAQITGCGFAAVFNLGTAVSNGFDLSLRAAAHRRCFKVGLQAAYTDAHYTSPRARSSPMAM